MGMMRIVDRDLAIACAWLVSECLGAAEANGGGAGVRHPGCPVAGTHGIGPIVPRAAAHDLMDRRGRVIPIGNPLAHVACEVKDAVGAGPGRIAADGSRVPVAVVEG